MGPREVSERAATVVYDGPSGVVLGRRRPVSHVAHLIMTVLTAGLWIFIWILMTLIRREDRFMLEVDPWGNVWARPVVGTS